jgi:uncharacterized membrane protein
MPTVSSIMVAVASDERGPVLGDWRLAEDVSQWIEAVAVVVIAIGVVAAFTAGLRNAVADGLGEAVERVKHVVGRGLLLGLDLLVAADVIRTVTLEPTLENVAALGLLVVVRTFLAWSLMMELHGRWPWQGMPAAQITSESVPQSSSTTGGSTS